MDKQDVVIVATARTALSKSFRGSFNDTEAPVLGGHVVRAVVERAGIEPGAVDDVIMGAAVQQAPRATTLAGCVPTPAVCPTACRAWPGPYVRFRLISIGMAAKNILAGEMSIVIGGGSSRCR